MKNKILRLDATQDFETNLYAPGRCGPTTVTVELALTDATFEKVLRACGAGGKRNGHFGVPIALPELLAILVSELKE